MAGLAVLGLVGYLIVVGLDRADKIGSAVGVVIAILGLVAPYLLPPRRQPPTEGTAPAPAGKAPAAADGAVHLHDARGVQVNLGGSNTQHNTFGPR
ncbi:hypothetical protein GCM10017556_35360 [Micromonospora sagamiensis]|nr:hypothetical protein GCM10017556_35360 [Micromonospora sagamiensis]